MSEWKEYKLGDLAKIQTGPFGSQLHASDYVTVGIPSIMPTNIGQRLDIRTDQIVYVDPKDIERLKKYKVVENDIVYSRRGDVEKCAFITEQQDGWLCGTGCLRIRFSSSDVLPKFVAYYLSTPDIKSWVLNSAVGTTMPNLNSGILTKLPLRIPEKKIQKQISNTLSSLDDKIDLLHRQNKTLEAMTETLFRQWFVNDEWQGSLSEYVKVQSGYAFKGKDFKQDGFAGIIKITNISMESVDTDKCDYVDEEIISKLDTKFKIRSGDFLIAMTGAEIGKIGVVANTKKEIWLNQRVGKLEEKVPYGDIIGYMALKSNEGQDHIINACSGSAQENISSTGIEEMSFLSYDVKKATGFGEEAKPMFEKIIKNLKQLKTISILRDTLLPKLMNGVIQLS